MSPLAESIIQKLTFAYLLGLIKRVLISFFIFSIIITIIYKFAPVPFTYLMFKRWHESAKPYQLKHTWVPYEDISKHIIIATIISEDQYFLSHFGFDIEAMQEAFKMNDKKNKFVRGGSTISQQTAKNVFLWPNKSYFRKTIEAYFTVLIELIWGKERIMEVYLNSIEMGNGIFGIEAAAQKYYKKSAKNLTKDQAAAIIACLPNPRKWNPISGQVIVVQKKNYILHAFNTIAPENYLELTK